MVGYSASTKSCSLDAALAASVDEVPLIEAPAQRNSNLVGHMFTGRFAQQMVSTNTVKHKEGILVMGLAGMVPVCEFDPVLGCHVRACCLS
jgi:hypothetical protein